MGKRPAVDSNRSKRTVKQKTAGGTRKTNRSAVPADYVHVLADMKELIADSRRRALATVNRELVCLYWQIGALIVRQQETAKWGDGVVEKLAADLRMAFPEMKGLSLPNIWKMRQFFNSSREIDNWLSSEPQEVDALRGPLDGGERLSTVSKNLDQAAPTNTVLSTVSRELASGQLAELISQLSWSHHTEIQAAVDGPGERYFYMAMSVRERWSVRELRRQINADLFTRYVSVKRDPEKCLAAEADSGELLPFKDHYILEFLDLEDQHSELQLRKAILGNLRDFFLEFGKDLTFVGEEYPMTIDADTFHIDLLFFHRRLRCLIAIDLKKGKFKPEYTGKMRFYCAGLDECLKLPHENPSLGLVLCRSASAVQVRLALTDAAEKTGVATYQTALPDERLIRQRIKQLPDLPEEDA